MWRRTLFLGLGMAAATTAGCVAEDFNRCTDGNATRAECEAACEAEESPPDWCAEYLDGGTTDAEPPDADAEDAGTDAGPCGGCEPGTVCDTTMSPPACVECMGDEDCSGETPACDPDTKTCVACTEDADCTDPEASRCDSSGAEPACAPCETGADCEGLDGLGVCDTSMAPAVCVQCTCDDTSGCEGDFCHSSDNTCLDTGGSAGLCESCTADSDCAPGRVCVEMTFGDGEEVVGSYCLWRQDACGGDKEAGVCPRPYFDLIDTETVGGAGPLSACALRSTTCPGLNDFSTATGGCTDRTDVGTHTACGAEGFDDGLCVDSPAGGGVLCTVPCLGDQDCKTGSSCDTGETPNRCEL